MALRFSLKRLLLGIPVLWLLITVVFLLSRLLPGTYGTDTMQYAESATYKSTQQQRDQAYQDYLKKSGQDLPAFYFSLYSKADEQQFTTVAGKQLEQLSWQYGDPQQASEYLNNLHDLIDLIRTTQNPQALTYLYRLQQTSEPDSILHYTTILSGEFSTEKAKAAALSLQQSAITLTATNNSYRFLLPAFQWHGTNNQYHRWLMLLVQGNLGESFKDARPVSSILWEAVTNTFWLIIISMLLTVIVALELSILMVRKTRINWHKLLLPGIYILDSIPLFVLSLLLLVLLATPDFLPIFPAFGLGYHTIQPENWYKQLFETAPYLVLPIICLFLANLPYLTNQMYRALADTMQTNYIKTARSKGLKDRAIIRRHALRNALLPVITVLSDFLPALVAGTVVIETIFAIPGIGRLLITSVLARDFPVILGIVLMVAVVKMLSHVVADICYAYTDPRVQRSTAS